MSMCERWLLPAAVAAFAVATLGACGGESAAAARAGDDSAQAAARGDSTRTRAVMASAIADAVTVESVTVDAPAALPSQLHVEHDAYVAARTGGTVEALLADIGTAVAAGATLARVENADQQLALERAEVERSAAERLALRARALTRAGGVTAADSDQAELALRRTTIALAEARRALALTSVTAPFAGVVSARRARPGQLVRAGDTLFRVTQTGPLLARVNVPEAMAAALRPGTAARITAAGTNGRSVTTTGVVQRLAPAVDAASGTREVVLRVTARDGLLPGSGILVRLGTERRRALAVPRTAVSADGYALVVQDGRPTLRAVLAGEALDGGRVEVLGGLVAGERVARVAP
jgi:RND family efflux transporter MFP subunit